MPTPTRRNFLTTTSLGLFGTALAAQTPGAPPTFASAPAVGPHVTPETFAEAEKLTQTPLNPHDREQAARSWPQSMAGLFERRTGPRKLPLEPWLQPATVFNPLQTVPHNLNEHGTFLKHEQPKRPPMPQSDDAIAFAPLAYLASWMHSRQLTSTRLTRIYLDRIKKFDPQLRCVITLCEEHALEQARIADEEMKRSYYRGPLHGIPWGAKDLLDTAGIATTYGAEPFRNRVPTHDATVTARLNEAGAVLIAKLSLGALAMNDVWFGGQTMNPWCLEEGASGSSAGPAAAVAAGLVGFAIGSETQGSIVSPSMRCGVTGLRPTYGRVPRTGAMTLSWTCDKLGVLARSVEDTLYVLADIYGSDGIDKACIDIPLNFDPTVNKQYTKSTRIGYIPSWMSAASATDVDRTALESIKRQGFDTVPIELPDWPYDSLNAILFAESAAAFEDITLNHTVDQLKMQTDDAWPNLFRQARFVSAVDFVQADRMRRKVCQLMQQVFEKCDILLVPSLREEQLVITNFTGHPSLTMRAGFVEITETRSDWASNPAYPKTKFSSPRRVPYGVTLIAPLFEEGSLAEVGILLEQAFEVSQIHPEGFA